MIAICRLTVSADPSEGAAVNGGGRYKVTGGTVYISTSAKNTDDYTYKFKYWTLDGVQCTTSQNFLYTPTEGNHELVAHYEKAEVVFDPKTPDEPTSADIKAKHYLYLGSSPDGVCSFNIASGDKHEEGTSITIKANYTSDLYQFDGWSVNGTIVSTSSSYTFTMPTENVTYTAMFTELEWDPETPLEPGNTGQTDVDVDEGICGDIDRDGDIDKDDLTLLVQRILDNGKALRRYDIRPDGKIDIQDITKLIELLKEQ